MERPRADGLAPLSALDEGTSVTPARDGGMRVAMTLAVKVALLFVMVWAIMPAAAFAH